METDGKGGFKITYGKGAGKGLTKPTQAKIEKGILDDTEALMSIRAITKRFEGTFLTAGGKLNAAFIGLKSRFRLGTITPQDNDFYRRYSSFMSQSKRHVVKLLNQLSGAAITPEEAKRILTTIPDPGATGITGILSGDDPLQYLAKLEEVQISLLSSIMRLHYYRNKGMIDPGEPNKIPTDQFGVSIKKEFMDLVSFWDFVEDKFAKHTDELTNQGISGEELIKKRKEYLNGRS